MKSRDELSKLTQQKYCIHCGGMTGHFLCRECCQRVPPDMATNLVKRLAEATLGKVLSLPDEDESAERALGASRAIREYLSTHLIPDEVEARRKQDAEFPGNLCAVCGRTREHRAFVICSNCIKMAPLPLVLISETAMQVVYSAYKRGDVPASEYIDTCITIAKDMRELLLAKLPRQ